MAVGRAMEMTMYLMRTTYLQRVGALATIEEEGQHAALRAALEALRARNSKKFAATLNERKHKEREWANFSRVKHLVNTCGKTKEQRRGNAKWYSTTQLSLGYRDAWLEEKVAGKVFLDYASRNGLETLKTSPL